MSYPQKGVPVNNHYQYVYLLILVNRRRCAPPFRFVQDTGIAIASNPMPIRKTVQQGPKRIQLDDKFFFDAEPMSESMAERMPASRPHGQEKQKTGNFEGVCG